MQHLLFICGRNQRRSPTAEELFAFWPDVETASAGISSDADVPVTPELLAWGDLIFIMEPRQREKLNRAFSAELRGKRVVCLNIPDDYAYQEPALIEFFACPRDAALAIGAVPGRDRGILGGEALPRPCVVL
jgi:predicted protein tyrosine phosphatase